MYFGDNGKDDLHPLDHILPGFHLERLDLIVMLRALERIQQIDERTSLPAINALINGVALGDMIAGLLEKEAA